MLEGFPYILYSTLLAKYMWYQNVTRNADFNFGGLGYGTGAVRCVACGLCADAWKVTACWNWSCARAA
jgi:hypothetical protein